MEEWKDINGFDNYMVSSFGRVMNIKTNYILKPINDQSGYIKYNLFNDGRQKTVWAHRLVAEAFIPNPFGYLQVNHKDENKCNNTVSNLEWCNAKYNNNYGTRNQRIGKCVRCIETGNTYYSTREAERQTGIIHVGINYACNGKQKTAGGYHWEYIGGDANNER